MSKLCFSLLGYFFLFATKADAQFVQRKGGSFLLEGKPYYYIGTNYWYGGLLSLEKKGAKGVDRLRKELDFLKSKGVSNLRVMAGAEGEGLVHGVERVGPPLQAAQGKFNTDMLNGLDVLLHEMGKRNMKAVLFLSNNWEWSGGFLQYLRWNNKIADSIFRRKLSWDEMRDYVSQFYSCAPCKKGYLNQVAYVLNHTNTISGKKYTEEPAIMAWELANEPRPMRPAAAEAYSKWMSEAAAFIRARDKNHLITTGHEGEMGSESLPLFEQVHRDKNIDYLTIHIWPKNWGWFQPGTMESDFANVVSKTVSYINKHIDVAQKLAKPLVVEEFGLPRDQHSFDISSTTQLRNRYYDTIFSIWQQSAQKGDVVAGANFWAFNGMARPIKGQTFWKKGDDYMGDPPMEEQGLNGVFDSDRTTWDLIYNYTSLNASVAGEDSPSDKEATTKTVNLYRNLKKLLGKGVLFGHQDDLAYGVHWRYEKGRSDIKEVAGDYPALYGWELGNLEHGLPYNLDSVPFDKMQEFIKEGYARGGVVTLSWHNDNPLNGESAWDASAGAVASVLPGGVRHELYKTWLNRLAAFLQHLKSANGEYIPVLFRPYHELTGNWFWWGKHVTSPTQYKLLWRFTVDYLKNVKGIHHLLYVFNTAGDFNSKEEFLQYYPGDDVVDVVSFDAYQQGDPQKDDRFVQNLNKRLNIIEEVAKEKTKIPAFAETGYEAIPYAQWWTNTLWKSIAGHNISYVLVWRNHGLQANGNMHYYAPYKGQTSASDFVNFYKLDKTLFEKEAAKARLYDAPGKL